MAKAKGTGRGTGKKGWNRWQAAERRAANRPKPYKSKGTKGDSAGNGNAADRTAGKASAGSTANKASVSSKKV